MLVCPTTSLINFIYMVCQSGGKKCPPLTKKLNVLSLNWLPPTLDNIWNFLTGIKYKFSALDFWDSELLFLFAKKIHKWMILDLVSTQLHLVRDHVVCTNHFKLLWSGVENWLMLYCLLVLLFCIANIIINLLEFDLGPK